jgi:hypothetical protein
MKKRKKKKLSKYRTSRRVIAAQKKLNGSFSFTRLKLRWLTLPVVQRAELVAKLAEEGISNRQIAAGLKSVEESTIRRDLKIAELPRSYKQQIESGESAHVVLAEYKASKIEDARQQARERESRTGCESDQARKEIVDFLMGHGVFDASAIEIMEEAIFELHKFDDNRKLPATKIELQELIRKCQPKDPAPEGVEHF